MFITNNFYKKDAFFKYLHRLSYNIDSVIKTYEVDNAFRKKIAKMYKVDFLKNLKGIREESESYIKRWIYLFLIKPLGSGELLEISSSIIEDYLKTEPKKLRGILNGDMDFILKETASSYNYKIFKGLYLKYKDIIYGANFKLASSYEKISEERQLPFKSMAHYEKISLDLLGSQKIIDVFRGLMLSTGLRPSDLQEGSFYIKDKILYIREIKKTGLKDAIIYTIFSPYLLLLKILLLKENLSEVKRIENNDLLLKLSLSRNYDLRSLYANSLYYLCKENISLKYNLSELELTKPAFLNKILHHIEGSTTFMNYSSYVFLK